MSDEDLFGSGDEAPAPEAMDVEAGPSAAAAGSDDENLFGSDDEGGAQWVDGPKTEEEKLAAILGTAPASGPETAGQTPKVREVEMTKGKMYLQPTHTLSKDVSKLQFVKTPRFIKIQSKEYDPSNYDGEDERTEFGALTSDVIRWRYKTDDDGNKIMDSSGKPVMESNARLQKLKNGKFQLVIGKSVFDVATEKMTKNYLYMSNLSEPPVDGSGLTDEEVSDGVDLNESTNLTMACTLDGANRMTIQPRLDSRTHAHVNQAISKKYRKQDRMNVREVRDILENPEETAEKEEKEERARLINERKGRDPDRAGGYSHRERDGRIGMSSDYLNEDQYDEINLSDIKRGVDKKKKKKTTRRSKREGRGRLAELDEGEEVDEDDEEDSEDEDGDDDDLDGFIVKGGDEGEDEDDEEEEGESDEDDEPKYFKKGNKKDKSKKKDKKEDEAEGDSDSDLFASDEEPERPVAKRSLDEGGEGDAAEAGAGEADGAPQRKKVRKGVIAGDSDDE